MRRIRKFLIAVLAIVGLTRPASAQGTLIGMRSPRDSTVAMVLERAGCDPLWISQVLADSHIDPADMREHRLPMGQKLYLRSGSCKARPPAKVADLSRHILGLDRPAAEKKPEEKKVVEVVRVPDSPDTLSQKISTLRDSLTVKDSLLRKAEKMEVEKDSVKLANKELQGKNATLELEKGELQERAAQAEKLYGANRSQFMLWLEGHFILFVLVIVASVFLLTVWLMVALYRRQEKKYYKALREDTVNTDDGKQHIFALASAAEAVSGSGVIATKRRCPYCEKLIPNGKENAITHLAKCTKRPRLANS